MCSEDTRFRGEAIELRVPQAVSVMFLRCQLLTAIVCLSLAASGCSLLPNAGSSANDSLLRPSGSADHFQAATKARENNAIVLHIIGAKEPSRIIPLPSDGTPAYISSLLKQSGVSEEFANMDATLHRNSTDVMSGVKMGVRFIPKSNQVAPEYDYVLQPGDRLEVSELKVSPLDSISSMFSPGSNRRAVLVR